MFFLGIDIAKRTMAVALLRPDGKWRSKSVANTADGHGALLAWVGHHAPRARARVLEATGTYGTAVAETLHDAGHRVSIVNPAAFEAFSRSRVSRKNRSHRRAAHRLFCRAKSRPVDTAAAGAARAASAGQSARALEGMR